MLTARTLQVLLVGDAAMTTDRTAKVLHSRRLEAVQVDDLLNALDRLNQATFDAVILDPDMDGQGIDAIMALRAGRPTLPILVIQDDDDSEISILRAGADGAVERDADGEELEEAIQYAVARRHEAVNAMRNQSREVSEVMATRFLQTVANHLYAPVTPILLQLPRLQSMAKTEAEQNVVDRLEKHLAVLDDTIHRVVEAANFLQSLPPPLRRPTALKDIAAHALKAYDGDKDRIRIDLPDLWVEVDPNLTTQALAFLVHHATGGEGSATISYDQGNLTIQPDEPRPGRCAELFPKPDEQGEAPMQLYKARQLMLAQGLDISCHVGLSTTIHLR